MDKKHYHFPLPSRPLCPVCKKAVYSRSGIHPQCAMLREDLLNPTKKGAGASGCTARGRGRREIGTLPSSQG